MKNKKFIIPSLLAAGLVPAFSSAEEATTSQSSLDQDISEVIASITGDHQYTLAWHGSHHSHASHASHHSHFAPPGLPTNEALETSNLTGSRNERSTPPKSFLPSSPGVLKKVKFLPGNSDKFQKIVVQVQVALHVLRYDVGAVNGNMHANTVAAVYKYQMDRGMVPSGKITHQVLDSLGIVAQ